MKKRGSAIVIAMLLITAIGVIVFGMGRLLVLETGGASMYENGAVAYYAAESGLEEGFLRYRFNQNAEVPFASWKLRENKVFRTTLGDVIDPASSTVDTVVTGTSFIGIANTTYATQSSQVYDLRMGYIGTDGLPFYGHDVSKSRTLERYADFGSTSYATGDYSALKVPKDNSIKLVLTGLDLATASNELELNVKYYGTGTWTDALRCKALLEVEFVTVDSSGKVSEYKDLLTHDKTNCPTFLSIDSTRLLETSPVESLRYYDTLNNTMYVKMDDLRSIFTRAGASYPTASTKITLFIKPLGYDAAIGLFADNCWNDSISSTPICLTKSNVVPGPFTEVNSIGKFGGVTKQLKANIDRQSGTLYDLYDYVIFKQN